MRDDVKDLFDDLLLLLSSRKMFLNSLLENEKSIAILLKSSNDNDEEILKIIEKQSSLIDEINIKDYHISQIKDEINRKYNIDFARIFIEGYSTSESLIMKFRSEVLLHEVMTNRITSLKKQNNYTMEKRQEVLRRDIYELERMRRLKMIFPKDPQSC